MQLFLAATQMVLDQSGVQNTSSVILPMAVLAAVARGFAGHIASNSKKFMEKYDKNSMNVVNCLILLL